LVLIERSIVYNSGVAEYLEVVDVALDRAVPGCTGVIQAATDSIEQMLWQNTGRAQVEEKFRLMNLSTLTI